MSTVERILAEGRLATEALVLQLQGDEAHRLMTQARDSPPSRRCRGCKLLVPADRPPPDRQLWNGSQSYAEDVFARLQMRLCSECGYLVHLDQGRVSSPHRPLTSTGSPSRSSWPSTDRPDAWPAFEQEHGDISRPVRRLSWPTNGGLSAIHSDGSQPTSMHSGVHSSRLPQSGSSPSACRPSPDDRAGSPSSVSPSAARW